MLRVWGLAVRMRWGPEPRTKLELQEQHTSRSNNTSFTTMLSIVNLTELIMPVTLACIA